MKKINAIIIAAIAAGLLFAWFGSFSGFDETDGAGSVPQATGPVKVSVVSDTTAPAVPPAFPDSLEAAFSVDGQKYFSGIVEPVLDVKLALPAQGVIRELLCREGQRVSKGAPLVSQERSLEALEVDRRKMIWQSRAELDAAESSASIMAGMLKMNRSLYDETRSISREELDQLTMQWQKAIAERDRLRLQEKREKAEYEQAVEAWEARLLRAPAAGVVEKVYARLGETSQPSQPLVRLVDTGRCILVLNLDDTARYPLKQGMPVDLEISNGKELLKRRGIVANLPETVDPASGVRQMKVWLDNRDGSVMPGVIGRMRIPEAK